MRIPARKKPRLSLQASLPTIAADADTLNAYASPDAAGVAVAVAVAASADAGGTDPVAASPLKPNNAGAAQATQRRWTLEEDTKLTSAVNTTKKVGEKHNGNNWTSIAALVPGRTKQQCLNRWYSALAHKRDETTARVSKWTKEED
jgi:hypothetical protein